MILVEPARAHLPSFVAALRSGWSPNNIRDVSAEYLARIEADADGFLAELIEPKGSITLPTGEAVPYLPQKLRWMWDGEFAGWISLRWQPGTAALPPYVLGHIGYAVVPWKRRRGYATMALASMLREARDLGLPHVDITCDLDNVASRRVIETNGGRFVETFVSVWQPDPEARYRVEFAA